MPMLESMLGDWVLQSNHHIELVLVNIDYYLARNVYWAESLLIWQRPRPDDLTRVIWMIT